jgi:superfamily II DNA or RNA helicase
MKIINSFCFVTTNASFATKFVQDQISLLSNDVVFVVDEAHNMGSENYQKTLPKNIPFRLALSATIDRHNDEEGTSVLKEYFGEKCIEYSLKDAIENGMLTRYYYYPVLTYLNDKELENYIELTKQIIKACSSKNGKTVLTERAKQLLIIRSRIIAGTSDKILKLKSTIQPFKDDKHMLIYCGATSYKDADEEDIAYGKRQIEVVAKMLGDDVGLRLGKFTSEETAEERAKIRAEFEKGDLLQALVAIKCLDEGVNIPNIKKAFILASSTNPKEYIQRRGRVLRKAKGKQYAEIYDFITLPFDHRDSSSQSESIISSTKGLIRRELIRMLDFAEIAENPSETTQLVFELKHLFNISEKEIEPGENENAI